MNAIRLIRRGLPAAAAAADRLQPLLLLAARLYVSWIFFRSGLLKLPDWDSTLTLFRETYQVPLLPPELAAYAGTLGELAFPVLVALGLAGRLGAVALFGVNAVAVVSYPELLTFECPAAIQSHVYWGSLLLALVAFGPGTLSLDHALKRRFEVKQAATSPTTAAKAAG